MEREKEKDREALKHYLWWTVFDWKSLEEIKGYLWDSLGIEINKNNSKKINISWWEKVKVNEGKIEVWGTVIDSCNPPHDWNLRKYNISIDYNWISLYNWKRNYDRTNLFKLYNDGFIVITETDVEWVESHRVVEVNIGK